MGLLRLFWFSDPLGGLISNCLGPAFQPGLKFQVPQRSRCQFSALYFELADPPILSITLGYSGRLYMGGISGAI